jgi:hypothetical protein
MMTDLAQWVVYLPVRQEVADSIPAQYQHLYVWTCLFIVGLGGVPMYNIKNLQKKY